MFARVRQQQPPGTYDERDQFRGRRAALYSRATSTPSSEPRREEANTRATADDAVNTIRLASMKPITMNLSLIVCTGPLSSSAWNGGALASSTP